MSSERLARIQPAMQRYIDERLTPGVVTAVIRRGKLIHMSAQGFMDERARRSVEPDTIFRIASMTKPIASVALMMLWEEGHFQLRDPVSKFLPEFSDVQVSTTADASGETGELVPVDRAIQIRDLLTHTAGLANEFRGTNTAHYRAVVRPPPDDTLEDYVKRLATLPLNYQPGTSWEYSAATDVVARLVEVIARQRFDVFLEERVFGPLGMTDTQFSLPPAKAEARLAAQYAPGEHQKIELRDPAGVNSRWVTSPSFPRGQGGLVSTVDDYLRFQLMILNGGHLDGARLLSPSTVSLMLENHTGDLPIWLASPGTGFGLGYAVVIDRGEAATPASIGTASWGGGYCTYSWVDREQEIVAVLMTQVRPFFHLNIRQDFQVLVYQAIVE